MKQFYNTLKILCLLAMIFPGMMAAYGIFEVYASMGEGLREFGANFTLELIMLLALFLFWKASEFFKKKSEEEELPVQPVRAIENGPKALPEIKTEPVKEIDLSDYPKMKETLKEIKQYQEALKKKNFRTGSYIDACINQLLNLFNDIVTTPMKNTDKGKKLIADIEQTLIQIRDSLGEVYSGILEGAGTEAEVTITALRNKLAADGLIKSNYDINSFATNRK